MSEAIKVEKTVTGENTIPAVGKANKVVWQCRFKNYREVLNIVDKDVAPTRSGNQPKVCIKARNWRIELDLNDPAQKKINDEMLKSKQLNVSFWQLKEVNRTKDSISDRADTLQRLVRMPYEQLMGMVTMDELEEAGLVPGQPTQMQLVMLIIDKKKLEGGKK